MLSFRTFNIILVSFYLIFQSFSSKAQEFDWAVNFGNTGNDYGRDVITDASGNVYHTGFFSGTVDFDPGTGTANLTSAGGFDVYIQKLNKSGDLLWVKSLGTTTTDAAYKIGLDNNNNVYVAGRFDGTVDFDPGSGTYNLTAAGSSDIFILKLNFSGNFVWAVAMGGTALEQPHSMAVDGAGNLYASGVFQGTADFDPGTNTFNLTSAGAEDMFVVKLTSSGNFAWANSFGSTAADRAYSLTYSKDNNIYVTGIFSGTVDFDPGTGTHNLTSAGNFDFFVLKLGADGKMKWANSAGGTSFDFGWDITTDKAGFVYTTGYFQGTPDMDPGTGTYNISSNGNYDIFVQKQDSLGNFIWAKSAGGLGDDRGYSIKVDDSADIYITGYYQQTADFNPGLGTYNMTVVGATDFYLLKLDTAGNFMWAGSIGGFGSAFGLNLHIDFKRSIYIIGNYDNTVDFDPDPAFNANYGLSSAGGSDGFLLKLKQCISYSQIKASACATYKSPSGKFTWNKTGNYKDTVANAEGCDSIMFISLEIFPVHNTNIKTFICQGDSIFLGGAYRYTAGLYKDSLKSVNNCDSIISTNLKVYPVYAISKNAQICQGDSLFLGGMYRKTSNIYYDSLKTTFGCDSVIITNLLVNPVYVNSMEIFICQGDSAFAGGAYRKTPGNFTDIYTTSKGCDSTINTVINILPVYNTTLNATICQGDSILIAGEYRKSPGTFNQTLKSTNGCDSNIITTVQVLPNSSSNQNITACEGDSIFLDGKYRKTEGLYTDRYRSANGCDSIVTTQLKFNPVYVMIDSRSICPGDSIFLAGSYRKTAGFYEEHLLSQLGCDSIIGTELSIIEVDTTVTISGKTLTAKASNATYQWWNCTTDLPVPGETSKTFTPQFSGNFSVEITQNNCVNMSSCYFIQSIGIKEAENKLEINLFPNPAENQVSVSFQNQQKNIRVELISIDGKIISVINSMASNSLIISLKDQQPGIYFLKIATENGVAVKKFVKK